MSNITFVKKISRSSSKAEFASEPGSGTKHADYLAALQKLDNDLVVDGDVQVLAFQDKSIREGFRTYGSKYCREIVNSFARGWCFAFRSKQDGDVYILHVSKKPATLADKAKRTYSRKRKQS